MPINLDLFPRTVVGGDWDCATCVLPGTAGASSCSHPVWKASVAIGGV